jgi:hypothetical protein
MIDKSEKMRNPGLNFLIWNKSLDEIKNFEFVFRGTPFLDRFIQAKNKIFDLCETLIYNEGY